jgi:hypothetical protein
MLHDTGGNERAVRAAKFGRVTYLHIRGIGHFGPVIKSALSTIRVPPADSDWAGVGLAVGQMAGSPC